MAKLVYRYTNIASTIDIIDHKRITLLDPMSWEDKNDVHTMQRYKDKGGFKSVLALCFSHRGQTHHHWKIFADRSDGVCLTFKRSALERRLDDANVSYSEVAYYLTSEASQFKNDLEKLPFLKRTPYRDEKEFRVVYSDKRRESFAFHIPIELSDISRITISPWIPSPLVDGVKDIFRQKLKGTGVGVYRSELVESHQWKVALSDDGLSPK